MEADYDTIELHPLFDPIKKMYEFYVLGCVFVIQQGFQELVLQSHSELKPLIETYNRVVNRKIEGTRVKGNPKMYYVNICRLMAIAIFNILQCSKYHNVVKKTEIFKFAKHIRNGAAHENKFYLTPPITDSITWRKFTINQSLNNTIVFPDFMGAETLIFLMQDISGMIGKHEEKKNGHHGAWRSQIFLKS